MKKENKYLKLGFKCIEQIRMLKPEDGKAFLRLKKKAKKYLEKAKEFEKKC